MAPSPSHYAAEITASIPARHLRLDRTTQLQLEKELYIVYISLTGIYLNKAVCLSVWKPLLHAKKLWRKRPQSLFQPKSLPVVDSAPSHTSRSVLIVQAALCCHCCHYFSWNRKGGKCKSALYEMIASWVSECGNEIPVYLIWKTLLTAGLQRGLTPVR